jgi:hypothetical protein
MNDRARALAAAIVIGEGRGEETFGDHGLDKSYGEIDAEDASAFGLLCDAKYRGRTLWFKQMTDIGPMTTDVESAR